MKVLSREDVLNAPDLEPFEVEVEEWGGAVLARGLSGTQRQFVEDWYRKQRKAGSIRGVDKDGKPTDEALFPKSLELAGRITVMACVDENGAPLFTDQDLPALMGKSGSAIVKISEAVLTASGLTVEAKEEIEGESKGDQT